MFGEEPHKVEDMGDIGRGQVDAGAQMRLGLVQLVAGDIPAHEGRAHLRRLGEALDHVDQPVLHRLFVAKRGKDRQALRVQLPVFRLNRDGFVDLGQGGVEILRAQAVIDDDPAQQDVVGTGLTQGLDAVHGVDDPGAVRVCRGPAVIGRRFQGEDLRVLGRKFRRRGRVALRHLPVAIGDCHFRQRAQRVEVGRVLLGQPQVLRKRLAQVAPVALDLGIGAAGLLVFAVKLEDVAKLDDRAVHIALFQVGHAGLIEFFCPLLRGFAGRQGHHADGQEGGNKCFAERHRILLRASGRPICQNRGANMAGPSITGKVFARSRGIWSIQ